MCATPHPLSRALAGALVALSASPSIAQSAYALRVADGVRAIKAANPAAAADALSRAVRLNANHPAGWNAWGALLLATDNPEPAKEAFRRAGGLAAANDQARRGLALAEALQGRTEAAARALPATSPIRAYLAAMAGQPPPDSDADPSQLARAVRAYRTGEGWDAVAAAAEAGSRPALLATFLPNRPAVAGWSPRPSLKPPALAPARTVSGVVTLRAPEDAGATTAVFLLNDVTASLTNARPFTWRWDTTRVPNGIYLIAGVARRPDGKTTPRTEVVHVRNESGAAPTEPEGIQAAEALLDGVLTLSPDARFARYELAVAAEKAGNLSEARQRLEAIAADNPDYRDTLSALKRLTPGPVPPMVHRGPANRRRIALTFDDGPVPYRTPMLLDLLDDLGIRATFFAVGKQAAAHPDIIRRMHASGHDIQCHSWSHLNMARLSLSACVKELAVTRRLVLRLTNERQNYFRPPGGNITRTTREAGALLGMTPVMWTFNAGVTEGMPVEDMVPRYIQAARPGAIYLVHNGTDKIVQALPRVVTALRKQGYEFVTLSELLGNGEAAS